MALRPRLRPDRRVLAARDLESTGEHRDCVGRNPKRTCFAGCATRQPPAATECNRKRIRETHPIGSRRHVEFVPPWLSPWLPPRQRIRQPVGSNGSRFGQHPRVYCDGIRAKPYHNPRSCGVSRVTQGACGQPRKVVLGIRSRHSPRSCCKTLRRQAGCLCCGQACAGRVAARLASRDAGAQLARLKPLLLDTGPTVAFPDGRDSGHEWARRELCAVSGQTHTTAAVVTEVMLFLAPCRGGAILVAEFLRATNAVLRGFWLPSQGRAAAPWWISSGSLGWTMLTRLFWFSPTGSRCSTC